MATVFTLPNGIRCVHEERAGAQKAYVGIGIKSGAVDDRPEDIGLTKLTLSAMSGGTKQFSRQDLAEITENVGAGIGQGANYETTSFSLDCFKEDLETLFPVMADLALNPAFDESEVQLERESAILSLEKLEKSAPSTAAKLFQAGAFSGQMVGMNPSGTIENVKRFTIDQLKARHADLFSRPEDIVISFGGSVDLETAQRLAIQHFSHLQPSGQPRQRHDYQFIGGDGREVKDTKQVTLMLGFEAPGSQSPERFRYFVMREILAGGMSAPLFEEIREKRSLVYSVSANYAQYGSKGYFYVSAKTGKDDNTGEYNTAPLITEAINLLGRAMREGFSDDKIAEAKSRILRELMAAEETASNKPRQNMLALMNRGRLVPLSEIEALINDITNDDIRNVFADMLRDGRYALGAAGPLDGMPSPDEIKAMMTAQLDGVILPPKRPAMVPLASQFQGAATPDRQSFTGVAEESVLQNGLRIITIEQEGTVASGVWVKVGSQDELPQEAGISHMREHMPFKGTKLLAPGEISARVEGLGGSLNAYTSKDMTNYHFSNLLPGQLDDAIFMLSEMVFHSTIDDVKYGGGEFINKEGEAQKIEGERSVVLQEILESHDNQQRRIFGQLDRLSYSDHAAGKATLGTRESLLGISAGDMRAYGDKWYVPNNTVFVVTGPVKHEDVVAKIEKQLGSRVAAPVPLTPPPVFRGGAHHFEMPTVSTPLALIAMEGVGSQDQAAAAFHLLAAILGSGESSRLYKEIRTNKKLVHDDGIASFNHMQSNAGRFMVAISGDAPNIRAAVESMYLEIARLAEHLSPEELRKVKIMHRANMVSSMQSNEDICDWYGRGAISAGKLVTPDQQAKMVEAVTIDDIRMAARRLLDSPPAFAAVLPPGTDPALIPSYDELLVMRDTVLGVTPQVKAAQPVLAWADPVI